MTTIESVAKFYSAVCDGMSEKGLLGSEQIDREQPEKVALIKSKIGVAREKRREHDGDVFFLDPGELLVMMAYWEGLEMVRQERQPDFDSDWYGDRAQVFFSALMHYNEGRNDGKIDEETLKEYLIIGVDIINYSTSQEK